MLESEMWRLKIDQEPGSPRMGYDMLVKHCQDSWEYDEDHSLYHQGVDYCGKTLWWVDEDGPVFLAWSDTIDALVELVHIGMMNCLPIKIELELLRG